MEINKYSDIMGVMVTEDIPEGRMVLLTPNTVAPSGYFGSGADLPGVKLPDSAAEAARSFYVATWIVPNQTLPLYIPQPSLPFSLRRGGFDQTANLPLTGTDVHLTWPGQKEQVVIPSGNQALAFGGGVFTAPSGGFVYNANLVVGAYLTVESTAGGADQGKLQYSASATGAVAVVERFDATAFRLTFRTLQP